MQAIIDSIYKAGKAWVAFLIPIVIGLVMEVVSVDGTAIDGWQWLQLLGVASVQWLAVYYKTNWQPAADPTEV